MYLKEQSVSLATLATQAILVPLEMQVPLLQVMHTPEPHTLTVTLRFIMEYILLRPQFTITQHRQLELIPTTRARGMPTTMLLHVRSHTMYLETQVTMLLIREVVIIQTLILLVEQDITDQQSLQATLQVALRIIAQEHSIFITRQETHSITLQERHKDTIRLLRIHIRTTSMRMETRSAIRIPMLLGLILQPTTMQRVQEHQQLEPTHKGTTPTSQVVPLEQETQETQEPQVRQVQLVKLEPLLFSDNK
jgi:hypothetical protein